MLIQFKDVVLREWLYCRGQGKLPDHIGSWLENLKGSTGDETSSRFVGHCIENKAS